MNEHQLAQKLSEALHSIYGDGIEVVETSCQPGSNVVTARAWVEDEEGNEEEVEFSVEVRFL